MKTRREVAFRTALGQTMGMRRVSSAVERHAYTVLVGGSNPSPSSALNQFVGLFLQRYQN